MLYGLILLSALAAAGAGAAGGPMGGRRAIHFSQYPSATTNSFTWNHQDGTYRFGMQGNNQWRVERKYPDGSVSVRFAYKAPNGQVIDNSFTRGGTSTSAKSGRRDLTAEKLPKNPHSDQRPISPPTRPKDQPSLSHQPKAQHNEPFEDKGNTFSAEILLLDEGETLSSKDYVPYGALSKKYQRVDETVNRNGIVDKTAKSIVIILS